ncbi:MAG TPA: TIGR02677 family protein [Pirellulales bacterium]|nr:TIGR02677 family protein [Pirellulales bacterium]
MSLDDRRLKAFAYLDTEKTPLYRALMSLFVEAKAHFEIHLRPAEVVDGLQALGEFGTEAASDVESALSSLCTWRNLRRMQDTSGARTVEEFWRPRYLYQLTREGEAAERAVRAYEENILHPGELQTAALGVIRDQLQTLLGYARGTAVDAKKVHLTLSTLRTYFDQLTSKAQVFIGSIQRAIDLHGYELAVFIAYKEKLIEYLERFIGELVIATAEISDIICKLEVAGIERILRAAAEHDLVDAIDSSEEAIAKAEREWALRWVGLKRWFISGVDLPSQADTLRSCARSAIPSLLIAISGIHDRRMASSDRPTDLKLLARWFALTESDADAHRLWRTAFGLNPSRHLRVEEETLVARDQQPVSATTSWLASPPVLISPRLRKTGQHHRNGRPPNVIDRRSDKMRLAELAKQEAEEVERARNALATGKITRLSDLGPLNRSEFLLFLDLLGKALSEQKDQNAEVSTTSADGALQIVMKPTEDNTTATIVTSEGVFQGRDHYIRITGSELFDEQAPGDQKSTIRELPDADQLHETAGQRHE